MTTNSNKTLIFFRFEDLRVYHKAIDYALWVQENLKDTPDNPHKSFFQHFLSVSRAIPISIAEGSAFQKPQFIQQLRQGKSAIRECLVLSTLAQKSQFITSFQETESRNQLIELTKMIGALITSLLRNPETIEGQFEDETIHEIK